MYLAHIHQLLLRKHEGNYFMQCIHVRERYWIGSTCRYLVHVLYSIDFVDSLDLPVFWDFVFPHNVCYFPLQILQLIYVLELWYFFALHDNKLNTEKTPQTIHMNAISFIQVSE